MRGHRGLGTTDDANSHGWSGIRPSETRNEEPRTRNIPLSASPSLSLSGKRRDAAATLDARRLGAAFADATSKEAGQSETEEAEGARLGDCGEGDGPKG